MSCVFKRDSASTTLLRIPSILHVEIDISSVKLLLSLGWVVLKRHRLLSALCGSCFPSIIRERVSIHQGHNIGRMYVVDGMIITGGPGSRT